MKAPLVVSSILLMSSALALPATAESVHFVDGVYGRFDGDFDLSLSAGAAVVERGPTAAFMGRALYLGTAGPYVSYADSFGDRDAVPPRSLSLGIGVRPLWVPRWGLDLERGPAILDLTIDATTFDLGVLWASDAGGHLGKPGFEVALGTEVPLAGQAAGPWLGVRGALRWRASELASAESQPDERVRPALFLTLGWHFLVNTHLVDAGDRFAR